MAEITWQLTSYIGEMNKKIAVIGAGMSAVSIAHLLKDNADVVLFDKARGVGGRMSVRRAETYCFDHGAQYFTARTAAFQDYIQASIQIGLIERWNANYVKFERDAIIARKNWTLDEPRYVGVPGMNSFIKHLAEGLSIQLKTKITGLLRQEGTWHLLDDQGGIHRGFDWVISTAPAPQSAELLGSSFKYYDHIRSIEMRPCFALMLGFRERMILDFDAAHVLDADVSWIAANSSKPGRHHPDTLVIHSSECYAKTHLHDDRNAIIRDLCAEASQIIGQDLNGADFKAVHGWHYANNAKRESSPVFLDHDLNLAACGDWCQGGRVEGAFTSALNLVNKMKESIF